MAMGCCSSRRKKRGSSSNFQLSSPSEIFAPLLRSAGRCDSPSSCKRLYQQIKDHVKHNIFLSNLVVQMYGNCGALDEARAFFDSMRNRDIYTWNFILKSYAKSGNQTLTLQLFDQMHQEGMMPNRFLYVTMISLFTSNIYLFSGKIMHARISDGEYSTDTILQTGLVSMYAKCGCLGCARWIFERIPGKDAASWNSIIAGYAQHGCRKEAMELFGRMQHQGLLSNAATVITILSSCTNPAALADGRWLHLQIKGTELLFEDTACWNAIINVYAQHEESEFALLLFLQMQQEGVLPDKITFVSALTSCNNETTLSEGKRLHACIILSWLNSDIIVGNALINMYGKCSSLADAKTIFKNMMKRDNISYVNMFSVCASRAALHEGHCLHTSIMGTEIEADVVVGNAIINMYGKCGCLDNASILFKCMPEMNVVSWNGMLSVYAQNGLGEFALQLFENMESDGIMPNAVTFVCVLSACSHAGLLDEGFAYFSLMMHKHGLAPNADHFNCMIDMLARTGMLDEAENLIESMPFKASVVTWTTLLGACRNKIDAERAFRVAERLLTLDPSKSSIFVALSNICTNILPEYDASHEQDVSCSIAGHCNPFCLNSDYVQERLM